MTSPSNRWSDLDRPPLRESALRQGLVTATSMWTGLRVVESSPSTNADVAAAAREGAAEGLVVVAEQQTAGRGRLARTWTSPARAGLTFSVLLRPSFPRATWGWLPLLAGLAVAGPLRRLTALDVRLKWPNDVLVAERKLGGILAAVTDDGRAVVLGIGLNVTLGEDDLPVATATSLAVEGAEVVDRDPVLRAVLREIETLYGGLARAEGDAGRSGLLPAYVEACATLGRTVLVELPGSRQVEGDAVDIDDEGRLVVSGPAGARAVGAGDVVHVR